MDPEFRPIFRNPHLLTIASNFWPRQIDERRFPGTRRLYQTAPGVQILVMEHQPEGPAKGQVFFLHGLEGSCDAGYIKSFAQCALESGFGVHRGNLRSCGGTEDLSETMYHSGLTADTRLILEEWRSKQDGPLFLVGFSLGGNVALKLAGELGENDLLTGVCAISTPIDLAACVKTLDWPANRIYATRFLSRLKDRIRRKSVHSPELYSAQDLDSVRNIWQFDDRFTGPLFGFGSAENYYKTQSAQRFLHLIRTPTLVIQAQDDPIIPRAIYDHPAFRTNPALELVMTPHGGHLGFLSRRKPRFWVDHIAMRWMDRFCEQAAAYSSPTSKGTNVQAFTSG